MSDISPKAARRLEILTIGTLWPSLVVSLLAVGLVLTGIESYRFQGYGLMAVGLFVAIASVGFSYSIEALRHVGAKFSGGTSYDRRRNWNNLKVAALLLNGLAIGSAFVFTASIVLRMDFVQADIDLTILDRGSLILVIAIAASQALAHHYSLRFPVKRDTSGTRLILSLLGQLVGLLAVSVALLALFRGDALSGPLGLDQSSVPMLILGGHVFSAYALFVSRNLPTFSILYTEERDNYGSSESAAKGASVFAPVFLAFGLLMVAFLAFVIFGVGVVDIVSNVADNPIILGAFAFLVVAILVSLVASFGLARDQESEATTLWRAPRNPKEKLQQTVLISSVGFAVILFLFAFLTAQEMMGAVPKTAWMHFFCWGLMVMVGPYGFYMANEHRRIRMLEERFPDFLRDVASSHKGGLTLSDAVRVASRGEYGPLTVEIRKMADQLSWNVSFSEALVRFGDRVQTPLVERAVSLIQEANRSGGSTTDVLLAAARDAREIKNLENERRLSMSLYTVVIYITFFVFLAVAAVLYGQFVPELVKSSQAAAELGGGDVKGIGGETLDLAQFQLFYFMAAVMQGLGDGIVAGMMGAGRFAMGLRHSFIMVLISYLMFTLILV